ncbi:uncharacterized protein ACA1_048620 [Acanthamoeba castellanii str. Neff]|uniref:Essential protein Yae1 N-terminal domain-containing protein n=1 Tax=Acanthamoeba castellanii (strain ATCC 30010 / Neff) TaxID=1257118 RepID=L8GDY7_ACACF|nr:uncharacterized protein ACA1_048620 [Acanthamoeba castellanii str. Neff]ELR11059.1 hypothetical protein ACA1_048620 [Acanthamoeba castellanii str. Neff]
MEEDDFDGHEGGEDADVAYHRDMGERNYNRLHAIHTTAGFREGVGETSDDAVVQAGFNAGFQEGAALGFRRSLHRSLFTAVTAAYGDREAVAALLNEVEDTLRRWERRAGIAVGGGRWAIDASTNVHVRPIAEAAQCEEQARVEEQLMPQLLRAAGLPNELCDPARLAAHNPFALGGS